jgi:hypothetical protein
MMVKIILKIDDLLILLIPPRLTSFPYDSISSIVLVVK